MTDPSRPIGMFDSGVGGLTVLEAICKKLPNEKIIYLGDTARVPYGTKSRETVTKFSRQDVRFLIEKGVKLIVAACNTASALSLKELKKELNIPIVGVIAPGAKAAVAATKTKKIGVIGTEGTIKSAAYTYAIKNNDPQIDITSLSCPLFVPITEEGWSNHKIAEMIAMEYLDKIKTDIDVLVLGCTHYPLLKKVIQKIMGEKVTLVDSAAESAIEVEKKLHSMKMLSNSTGERTFYVSDNPDRFAIVAKRFLGHNALGEIYKIDIDKY